MKPCWFACLTFTVLTVPGTVLAQMPTPPPAKPLESIVVTDDDEVQPGLSCTVERIVDGDTIICDGGKPVSLFLIDAPEDRDTPHGAAATTFLRALIPEGTTVRLEVDVEGRDRSDRMLAYVYRPDDLMVNREMLRQGFAMLVSYRPSAR